MDVSLIGVDAYIGSHEGKAQGKEMYAYMPGPYLLINGAFFFTGAFQKQWYIVLQIGDKSLSQTLHPSNNTLNKTFKNSY